MTFAADADAHASGATDLLDTPEQAEDLVIDDPPKGDGRDTADAAWRRWLPAAGARVKPFLSGHWPFLIILAAGLSLRVITMLGYRWAMWFNDAFQYVQTAIEPEPHIVRPNGYVFFLQALEPFHSFALITTVQHLMGLGIAIMIYALLRRRLGAARWVATLAAAPVVLDAYQIQLEHMILSDVPFTFLMTGMVTLILWWRDITIVRGAALGALLALTVLTRSVGLALVMVVLVYLVIRRVRWTTLAVTVIACALPLMGYAAWFKSEHGKFGLSNSSGPFLYARVMKFADCHKIKNLPVEEMPLCTQVPTADRPSSQFYVWGDASPLLRLPGDMFNNDKSAEAGRFARRAILTQPGDYLQAVVYDVARVFFWNRTVFPDRFTYELYQFRTTADPVPNWAEPFTNAYEHGAADTRVTEPFAGVMRFYQKYFYLRGTLLGAILLVAVAGLIRRRDWFSRALLPLGAVAGLLVTPAASAEFDYRYVVPAIPMACLAAALAWLPDRDRRAWRESAKG
ncbi:phospholipid carrier-dependent glycosyltransferase [Actinomadura sp. 6N118]|uniref:phospholipid carrier-dependent glycosyltransferase n=1 Tax=Actinomadura sp. 6N118 TaxID=3375151 RepID=UPI0037BB00C2